jgi:hypothetical protein
VSNSFSGPEVKLKPIGSVKNRQNRRNSMKKETKRKRRLRKKR